MGTFCSPCTVQHSFDRSKSAVVPQWLADTGSEYTWVPTKIIEQLAIDREKKDVRFVMANGQEIIRSVGFAIVRVDEHFTIDEIVFGEEGDLAILGARTLVGMNLTVDATGRKLVTGSPVLAAQTGAR